MNNKTLLDEFAMAALGVFIELAPDDAAELAYNYAEAMMAERAKRMPAPLMHAVPADPWFPDGPMVAAPVEQPSFRARVLCQVEKMKGGRVTCTQVFQAIAGTDDRPSLWALQQIGGILRQLGFKRARSGGKDYYQL